MTFNLCARGATEGVAAARVAQKGGNRGRKRLRVVGKEDVLTMNEEEALGTDAGRHDRLRHCCSLENLQPRAAPNAEGSHTYGSPRNERPNIVDRPREGNSRHAREAPDEGRRGIAARDDELSPRDASSDLWKDLPGKEFD